MGVVGSSIGKNDLRKRNVVANQVGSRHAQANQIKATGSNPQSASAVKGQNKKVVSTNLPAATIKKDAGSNKHYNRRLDLVPPSLAKNNSTTAKPAPYDQEDESSFKKRTLRFTNNNFLCGTTSASGFGAGVTSTGNFKIEAPSEY